MAFRRNTKINPRLKATNLTKMKASGHDLDHSQILTHLDICFLSTDRGPQSWENTGLGSNSECVIFSRFWLVHSISEVS